MVERFNGCDAEVLATRRYDSALDLERPRCFATSASTTIIYPRKRTVTDAPWMP